jgi:hypothetical protein
MSKNASVNNDSPAAKLDFTIQLVGMTMLAKNNDLGHIAHCSVARRARSTYADLSFCRDDKAAGPVS